MKKREYIRFKECMTNPDFDWKFYTSIYDDLSLYKDEESAYTHYIQKGIFERRICNQKKIPVDFDWEFYISFYPDLKMLESENDTKKHFLIHGLNENRIYSLNQISKMIDLNKFDWKFYTNFYNDLKNIDNELHALHHYFHHGRHENRIGCNLNKNCSDLESIIVLNEDKKSDTLHRELSYDQEEKDGWNQFVEALKKNSQIQKEIEVKKMNQKNIIYKKYPEFDVSFYYFISQGKTNFEDNLPFDLSDSDKQFYYKKWEQHITKMKEQKNTMQLIQKNKEYDNSIPFITFIIPTLGRASLIQTVQSLINLKSDDWKAIILFDGVKNIYPINDYRIDIIEIEKKGIYNHAGAVRNIGLEMVLNKTQWISFLDDDDTICPYYIHRLNQEIKKDSSMELCLFRMIYPNRFILPSNDVTYIKKDYVGISFAFKGYIPTKFVNSSREDYYFLKQVEYEGFKMVISPFITYFIRQEPFIVDDSYQRVKINYL